MYSDVSVQKEKHSYEEIGLSEQVLYVNTFLANLGLSHHRKP